MATASEIAAQLEAMAAEVRTMGQAPVANGRPVTISREEWVDFADAIGIILDVRPRTAILQKGAWRADTPFSEDEHDALIDAVGNLIDADDLFLYACLGWMEAKRLEGGA